MGITEVVVNGVSYFRSSGADFDFPPNTIDIVRGRNVNWRYYIRIENRSNQFMRVKLINYNGYGVSTDNDNPTVLYDGDRLEVSVCLSV